MDNGNRFGSFLRKAQIMIETGHSGAALICCFNCHNPESEKETIAKIATALLGKPWAEQQRDTEISINMFLVRLTVVNFFVR